MSKLTHFNQAGQAHMVDIGEKAVTRRIAKAEGRIVMQPSTLDLIRAGNSKKGDVLGVARVAAIQAAKKTAELIPLCHPIPLTKIDIDFQLIETENTVVCQVIAETLDRTGIEMEALTAVSVCLLTIYDMCKAVDRQMQIGQIRLLEKSGGQSGNWQAQENS